jgi:hypothetical protein
MANSIFFLYDKLSPWRTVADCGGLWRSSGMAFFPDFFSVHTGKVHLRYHALPQTLEIWTACLFHTMAAVQPRFDSFGAVKLCEVRTRPSQSFVWPTGIATGTGLHACSLLCLL